MTNRGKPPLKNFIGSSKNYLIVAVLLFAFVCLFVSIAATSQTLESAQRWILIVFIILFTTVGMIVSVWLILRQSRQNFVRQENRESEWHSSSTESQRRKLNNAVREIAQTLNVSALDDIFSVYIVAQDLALREIQRESGETVLRNQSIGAADFDAVMFKREIVVCVEIEFVVAPDFSPIKISEIFKKINAAQKTFARTGKERKFRLLLVLITQLEPADEAKLRASLVKKFPATTIDIDIRLFDFENLRKTFAV